MGYLEESELPHTQMATADSIGRNIGGQFPAADEVSG